MKDQDFILIARLLGLTDDEVSGRGLATPEPRLELQLRRFANGEVPRSERGKVIANLLGKPELLGWFADCLNEANGLGGAGSGEGGRAAVGGDEEWAVDDMGGDGGDNDEVVGHDGGDVAQLLCSACGHTFAISGTPTAPKVYVCPCGAHNAAGARVGPRQWEGVALARITQAYRPPVALDSIFLRGPDDSVYELPRKVATPYKVNAARLKTLGHLPIQGSLCLASHDDDDVVDGRHMMPAPGGGAGPGDWSFHRTWEYGCYFSVAANAYMIGYHRHPSADERAVGASEADFA